MNIMIMNQTRARDYLSLKALEPLAVISITGTNELDAGVHPPVGSEILKLNFDDTVWDGRMEAWQAREAWDFFLSARTRFKTLVIHCLEGRGRSEAMAMAFHEEMGAESIHDASDPNPWVLALMRNVRAFSQSKMYPFSGAPVAEETLRTHLETLQGAEFWAYAEYRSDVPSVKRMILRPGFVRITGSSKEDLLLSDRPTGQGTPVPWRYIRDGWLLLYLNAPPGDGR